MTALVLTAAEIAERVERSVEFVEDMLVESVQMGILELAGGGYRLSPEAERCYGQALRELGSDL